MSPGSRWETTCQFWVTSTDGPSIPAGAWTVLPGQQRTQDPASVPVPPPSLRSFDLTSGGKVLLVIPVRPSSQLVDLADLQCGRGEGRLGCAGG